MSSKAKQLQIVFIYCRIVYCHRLPCACAYVVPSSGDNMNCACVGAFIGTHSGANRTFCFDSVITFITLVDFFSVSTNSLFPRSLLPYSVIMTKNRKKSAQNQAKQKQRTRKTVSERGNLVKVLKESFNIGDSYATLARKASAKLGVTITRQAARWALMDEEKLTKFLKICPDASSKVRIQINKCNDLFN